MVRAYIEHDYCLQPYAMASLTYPPPYVAPAMAAQQEQLRQFWLGQMQEIHQVGTDPAEFKNHQLPLARIKKVSALRPPSFRIVCI